MKNATSIVNSLWIGGDFSRLELLTLKSFVYHGHEFHLWVYNPMRCVLPKGVVLRDANEVIPSDRIFRRRLWVPGLEFGQGSLAPFSDIFRFKLLYDHGGWWVDMDITCLRPFFFKEAYVFRPHDEVEIVGNIMKCPKGSPLMADCYRDATTELHEETVNWLVAHRILSKYAIFYDLLLFRKNICNDDLWEESIVPFMAADTLIPSEWYAVHWCNERWRCAGIDKNSPAEGSTLCRLMTFFGV